MSSVLPYSQPATPEWYAWRNMRERCANPQHQKFPDYGGRGITVCDRWWDSFAAFYEDIGPRPNPAYSLDRRENDGHYSCGKCLECERQGWPANCRWATKKEQANNRRPHSSRKVIIWEGRTQSITQWATELGVPYMTLFRRVNRGWSLKDTMTVFGYRRPRINKTKPDLPPKNFLITWNGEPKTLKQWAAESGIRYDTLRRRIDRGWSLDQVFNNPLYKHRK